MSGRYSKLLESTDKSKYSFARLLRYPVKYYLAMGERGNGKTYGAKMELINQFIIDRSKFAYVRRRKDQITRKDMKKLFSDINDRCMDEDVLGDYIKYSVEQGFYIDEDGRQVVLGYPFSVEDSTYRKGIPWNDIKTIFFDEFIEYGNPVQDEISQFLNLLSTIIRKRTDVRVIMCANTVSKMSPYFDLFGIDVKKLKQGQIYSFFHQNGVSGAIEWCASTNVSKDGKKISDPYLGFDNNPTSSMILYGEWEYDLVNTLNIDGKGWNTQRRLLPIYVTAIGEVYELSILEQENPIAFVRKINTQGGMVRHDIKYNLSYDNSLVLTNKHGIVPMYGKINSLVDETTRKYYEIFKQCIEAKRIVYDKISSGSDFMKVYKYI